MNHQGSTSLYPVLIKYFVQVITVGVVVLSGYVQKLFFFGYVLIFVIGRLWYMLGYALAACLSSCLSDHSWTMCSGYRHYHGPRSNVEYINESRSKEEDTKTLA